MKAIDILTKLNKAQHWEDYYPSRHDCNEAIKELEELQNTIDTVIEEIDYALAKPDYAKIYLENAKRFLMEIK